jgi:hypothetical protein
MQQQVGQVMAGGIQTIQLTVQHVGHHRQGVPIVRHGITKHPTDAFPVQPVLDKNIRGDIVRIIVVEEITSQRRPVSGQRRRREQNDRKP